MVKYQNMADYTRMKNFKKKITFVGCQSTHLTSDPCPRKTRSSVQLKKSHTRTVPSSEQDANLASVGLLKNEENIINSEKS